MVARKLLDTKNVDLFFQPKVKPSRLKVSWRTYQGGLKKRGNPTIQYLSAR